MTPRVVCRVVDVDGAPVRVRGSGKPLTDADKDALKAFAEALKAEAIQRQEAAIERVFGPPEPADED